jgi:hypothetical protein
VTGVVTNCSNLCSRLDTFFDMFSFKTVLHVCHMSFYKMIRADAECQNKNSFTNYQIDKILEAEFLVIKHLNTVYM